MLVEKFTIPHISTGDMFRLSLIHIFKGEVLPEVKRPAAAEVEGSEA